MPWRNLFQNAAFDDLVGNFAARPLADRALRLLRFLAGQRFSSTHLVNRDGGWLASSGEVLRTLLNAEFGQRDRLPSQPTLPPLPHHIDADMQLSANLFVVQFLTGRQDDTSPQRNLLFRAVGLDQLF
jgi:hypothetical protein